MTIKIQGALFETEEEVWKKLKAYLESIQRAVGTSENAYEIFVDIETRVAEMLNERVGRVKRKLTTEDINFVIASLGQPQDFAETENIPLDKNQRETSPRKLVRDPDNKILGGVCSGIANYFNIDRVLIRVPFVIVGFLLTLWSVIFYFILWAIIPEGGAIKTKEQQEQERKKWIRVVLLLLLGIVLFIAFVPRILLGSVNLFWSVVILKIVLTSVILLSAGWLIIRYAFLWVIMPASSRTKAKELLEKIGNALALLVLILFLGIVFFQPTIIVVLYHDIIKIISEYR